MPKVYLRLSVITLVFAALTVAETEDDKDSSKYDALRQAQVHEALNAVKENQLLDILLLTEDEEEEFLDAYRELEGIRLEHRKDRIEILGELQKDLSRADVAAVSKLLDDLEGNDEAAETDAKNLRARMRALLQDEQYAKFVLFEANFEKKLLRLVMENRPDDLKKGYIGSGFPGGAEAAEELKEK